MGLFARKLRAAAIHLTGSFLLLAAFFALVLLLWYPGHLFAATGVGSPLLVLLAVDLSLGPLATFVVYEKNKKSLKVDLLIILTLQLLAFGYGGWQLYNGRPAWVVFAVDRFEIVRPVDIAPEDQSALRLWEHIGPPIWACVNKPDDSKSRNDLFVKELETGYGLAQRPSLYQKLSLDCKDLLGKKRAIETIPIGRSAVSILDIQREFPGAEGWVPMQAGARDMVVLLDGGVGVLGVLDLPPW